MQVIIYFVFLQRLGGIGLVLMATDKVMQHLPVLDIFPSSIPIVLIGNNSKDILNVNLL